MIELCQNGTIQDYIKHQKVSESVIKYFTASIINGLEYLQTKGIIHRDLKPCNILLDSENVVKITDFGTAKLTACSDEQVERAIKKRNKREMSRSISPTKKHSFVGTNQYISPEVLQGHEPSSAIDLWSLGIIVYELFTGKTPFLSDNEMITYQNILEGKLSKPTNIPSEAWEFIKALLKVDPMKRMGYDPETHTIDYSIIKQCAFFNNMDFGDLCYLKAVNAREASVSFGDCSTIHPDQEVDKFEDEDVDYESDDFDTPFGSVSAPCNYDDPEVNFNMSALSNALKFDNSIKFNMLEETDNCISPISAKSISELLKEDHFSEINRKYSLK